MRSRLVWAVAALWLLAPPLARAGYAVALKRVPEGAGAVRPGETFELGVELQADGQERNNSAVVQIVVGKAGLEYLSYAWAAPYFAGRADDDSKPRLSELPRVLDEAALSAPGYPAGVVDLELSNLTDFSAGPSFFRSGRLATLRFKVPPGFEAGGTVAFQVRSAEFADGFNSIPVSLGGPLLVAIQPAGTTYASWAAAHFGGTSGAGGPMMDPDGDQRANLAEYAFGTDPTIPQSGGTIRPPMLGGLFAVEFDRPKSAGDLRHVLELSNDLKTWRAGSLGGDYSEEPPIDLGGGLERVRWRPSAGVGPVFYRVRAELVAP